jgi:uncharacterized membrane-anchored protein
MLASMYYEEQTPPEEKPGCRDVWILTRAVFGVILPVLGVFIAILVALAVAFMLFAVHPALALLPIAALGAVIFAFAFWERSNYGPPPEM